jgi:Flp pilus assembly pilin Flp
MSLSTLPRFRFARSGRPDAPVRNQPGRPEGKVVRRLRRLRRDDTGMSTVEYAIGLVAAAGFAALLYSVVTGDSVTAALTQLVQRALTAGS